MLLRTFQDLRRKSANFSVSDIISECGFDPKTVHRRTISRYLNNNGFKLRQARKKGLLNENDKRLRTSYARGMRKILRAEPHFLLITWHFTSMLFPLFTRTIRGKPLFSRSLEFGERKAKDLVLLQRGARVLRGEARSCTGSRSVQQGGNP